jgi:hypothetical protein
VVLLLFSKKSLANLLEFPDTSSEYVQWVKIDSSIFGTDKNVLLGNIYIPPENTKYSCFAFVITLHRSSKYSPLKPLGHLRPNFGGMVRGSSPSKILSGRPDLQPTWSLLLKIKKGRAKKKGVHIISYPW